MHTREALTNLRLAFKAIDAKPKLPVVAASTQLLRTMERIGVADDIAAQDVMVALRIRIRAASGRGGVAAIPPRDLRDAPWLLWDRSDPLDDAVPGLFERVAEIALRRSPVLARLIEAWLRDFAPRWAKIVRAGEAIREIVILVDDRRMEVWRRADKDFRLFDAAEGPRRLARRVLEAGAPVAEVLKEIGFAEPIRATGGYLRQTQVELLAEAPALIRGRAGAVALARIQDMLVHEARLRFNDPEMRGLIARGLVTPWTDVGPEPSEDLARNVQRFLLSYFGDPRLAPQNWATAGDAVVAKMRHWLAKTSLKAFFDVIGQFAKDEHWDYRRAFWGAYLNSGAIDDAWLALGGHAHAMARSISDLGGAYGRLTGATSAQSVLLMRIGTVIFSEWSHDGKLRAWSADWKNAPRLGLKEYAKSDVTGAGLPFPADNQGRGGNAGGDGISHFSSPQGYWQTSAAELIRRKTRIDLKPQDWMPKRRGRTS